MNRFELKNKTILIISNEAWGDVWFSKHNYAYELSKNNKVYFFNGSPSWKLKNLISNEVTFERYNENLSIVNYQNFVPLVNKTINKLNNAWISRKLYKALVKDGAKDIVFWTFDPVRLYQPKYFNPIASIFHCVDLYQPNFFIDDIVNEVDGMLIVSEAVDRLEAYENGVKKYYLKHGISSENFVDEEFEMDIPQRDYALFVGVLDGRLDVPLFEKAIQQHPELDFVIVGPFGVFYDKEKELRDLFEGNKYPNLHVIGKRHFKTLKHYIKHAKVCLTFMDPTFYGNDIGHHKTLVYLSQGKPIVGYAFKEYIGHEDIMYMSTYPEENLKQLKELVTNGESAELKEKRIEFAKTFTYEGQLKKAEEFINKMLED